MKYRGAGIYQPMFTVKVLKSVDIRRCPFYIFLPDHYRADGTCKCDSKAERQRMKAWGYTAKDFKEKASKP